MATLSDLARGWMRKGDSDRLTAERILLGPGPYDTARGTQIYRIGVRSRFGDQDDRCERCHAIG